MLLYADNKIKLHCNSKKLSYLINLCLIFDRFLPTATNRRMNAIEREIRSLVRGIISKKEKAMRAAEATNDDLLGQLLESNMREIKNRKGNKNVGMSINDVIEECKLFYLAGQETTSALLTWAVLLLSIHIEWQERAREEVLHVFGRNKPDMEGLNRLKIVSQNLTDSLLSALKTTSHSKIV